MPAPFLSDPLTLEHVSYGYYVIVRTITCALKWKCR